MSIPLISDHQLAFMRRVVETAFTTDIDVKKRTLTDSPYEDEAVETYTYAFTVKGWIFSTPTASASEVGYQVGTLNLYRLFVPVGTDIVPGDRLTMSGSEFLVIDTINESTWLPLLRCSVRRLE